MYKILLWAVLAGMVLSAHQSSHPSHAPTVRPRNVARPEEAVYVEISVYSVISQSDIMYNPTVQRMFGQGLKRSFFVSQPDKLFVTILYVNNRFVNVTTGNPTISNTSRSTFYRPLHWEVVLALKILTSDATDFLVLRQYADPQWITYQQRFARQIEMMLGDSGVTAVVKCSSRETCAARQTSAPTNTRGPPQAIMIVINVVIVITGVVLALGLIGKLYAMQKKLPFRIGPILLYASYFYDFWSDVAFAVTVFVMVMSSGGQHSGQIIWFLCVGFIVFPLTVSFVAFFYCVVDWKVTAIDPTYLDSWMNTHFWFLIGLAMVSGSTFAAVEFCNTNLFGSQMYVMGLTRVQIKTLRQYRFFVTVLLENIPQVIIQVLWLNRQQQNPAVLYVTYLSLAGSCVSIVSQIFHFLSRRQYLQGLHEFQLVLELRIVLIRGSQRIRLPAELLKIVQKRIKKVRNTLANAADVLTHDVEVFPPHEILQGVRCYFTVQTNLYKEVELLLIRYWEEMSRPDGDLSTRFQNELSFYEDLYAWIGRAKDPEKNSLQSTDVSTDLKQIEFDILNKITPKVPVRQTTSISSLTSISTSRHEAVRLSGRHIALADRYSSRQDLNDKAQSGLGIESISKEELDKYFYNRLNSEFSSSVNIQVPRQRAMSERIHRPRGIISHTRRNQNLLHPFRSVSRPQTPRSRTHPPLPDDSSSESRKSSRHKIVPRLRDSPPTGNASTATPSETVSEDDLLGDCKEPEVLVGRSWERELHMLAEVIEKEETHESQSRENSVLSMILDCAMTSGEETDDDS